MRWTKWLVALAIAVLGLSGCASFYKEYPPPDVDLGTAIWKNDLQTSYAYFTPYFYDERDPYRMSSAAVFREKMFLIRTHHMKELLKYVEGLEDAARNRCE